MSEHVTVPIANHDSAGSGAHASGSSFSDLSPEIQGDLYRRLGGMGLVYAGTWAANYLYYQATRHSAGDPPELFWHLISLSCVAAGVAVFLLCRKQRIPPRFFNGFATTFQVLAAVGIMGGWAGWEHNGDFLMTRVGALVGIPAGEITARLIVPLTAEHLRLFYHEGVPWVGVWLLVFPLVVPASTGRTVVAALLTAAVVPAYLATSLLLNGIPETMSLWVWPYVQEASVSTFICAGIAIFGSRVVYNLTRDLSKAQRMGSYQLVEKIGEGGMGEVWKASHRMLVRPAAIKLIRAKALGGDEATTRTAVQRFRREAQATSGLSSPHSIELYDFGITDDGTFYYVMQLLHGVDLKRLVEKHGPLPAERVIHILRQACHSLHDAHLTGVVHRDIKPGNIFVCRSGADYDFVKVLDFGLVKQVDHRGTGSTQLTMEGVASGTPSFMPPEMAYDTHAVDGRADLYALGCVGYWLLTGELVFEGESPVSILVQHVKDPPPPPSVRTELPIPEPLERIILGCLEKEPGRRPASAHVLSEQLAECAAALPTWSETRAAQWWETHLPEFARAPGAPMSVDAATSR